ENQSDCTAALPRLKTLLISGGDERLLLNPETGYNRYYCPPYPEDCQAAFGSTTASAISRSSYDKLKQYRNHLLRQLPCLHSTGLYEQEMQQLRLSFLNTGEFETNSRPDLIFAASGTDALYIAARLCASLNNQPLSILMIEPTESGRGVPDALKGQWGTHQPTLHSDSPPSSITRTNLPDVYAIPFRQPDGSLRNSQEIDAGFVTLAEKAIAGNRRALIVLTDVSKTGGLAPGLACCLKLAQQYPNNIHLLVDACQFRISPQTLKAYLSHGFMIALTGSKFLTGPAFSGALLIPDRLKERYRQGPFPEKLAGYGARGDWPENWPWRSKLPERANFGLLFRWTAALEEWKAFLELPHTSLVPFLFQFREALLKRFHKDPLFELLPVPDIHRQPLSIQDSWDSIQTIFPFRLYHNGPVPIHLSRHET
ncbi:MAG: hypothetical protein KGL58_07355, partial [Pseudomonadota bacterium]|nr:hypothetical protein [Pseudomonadota bacterium]